MGKSGGLPRYLLFLPKNRAAVFPFALLPDAFWSG